MVQRDAQSIAQREEPQEWRIDELAQRAGVASRTIRFYNTHGLLPIPLMRGRVAYYGQEHVVVLRIIRELKEQQHLPLEIIKDLLEIRAQRGDMQMNLTLNQRFTRGLPANTAEPQLRFSRVELARWCAVPLEYVDALVKQDLLFPQEFEGATAFTGDDVRLIELYVQLEQLGLPLSLPALMRFQLKQLARSEIAAYEQHVVPRWHSEGLSLEEQTAQFEHMLTLAESLLAIMHKRLLYQM